MVMPGCTCGLQAYGMGARSAASGSQAWTRQYVRLQYYTVVILKCMFLVNSWPGLSNYNRNAVAHNCDKVVRM